MFALILSSIALAILCVQVVHAEEVIWQKQIGRKQTLVASKKELPRDEEVKKALDKSPGSQIDPPDHVFLYSLTLDSPDQKPQKALWSKTLWTYDKGFTATNFQVLDAVYRSGVLVLVYKQSRITLAEVEGTGGSGDIVSWQDALLTRDIQSENQSIASAVIQGAPQSAALSVLLTTNQGVSTRFLKEQDKASGKAHWVKQPAALSGANKSRLSHH